MLGTREKGAGEPPSRGELQDDLMRFEGRFSSRLVAAFRPLIDSPDLAVGIRAARDELAFMSSALDIAVGPAPEVDLLDMMTLVALGRDAMGRRWSVDTCGAAARGVADAFQTSLDDISTIARGVVSGEVEAELGQVMHEWRQENPDRDDVAGVRLSAYAKYRAGAAASAAGLFAILRGAAQTADTAVLLGDRALYATQRLPYLVQLHTRIAGREIVEETRRAANEVVQRALLTCAGLAAAGAASWVLARASYRWLRAR